VATILLVDDEPTIRQIVEVFLIGHGHVVRALATGEQAVEAASTCSPDVAILDVRLPGMNGIDAFSELRKTLPMLGGIFITAHGSIPSAVRAIRAGGFDYLTKPFDNDDLLLALNRLLELRQLKEQVTSLREELGSRQAFPGIVGRSGGIQELLRVMGKVADSDERVLILGESGTGKELVARSLHRQSRRRGRPFVPVNCSAIPATLVEDEFFGHERGAFTDARQQRIGRFEQANRGTLFLDEIGDLPLEAQAKLLRVLEDGVVTRVGARESVTVDVRVLAATNQDLEGAIGRGRFREDLYWRLNVVTLHMPPLRDRLEDVPLLIDHLLDRLNQEMGRVVSGLSDEAHVRVRAYGWPGNVRQLENALRRAMLLADSDVIQVGDLPPSMIGRGSTSGDVATPERLTLAQALRRSAEKVERTLIEATLAQYRGKRKATAEALGINRRTLFEKMRDLGLSPGADEDSEK